MANPHKGDGRKRITPAARRRQLLDAAAAVFRRKGYAGATADQVAAQAGVRSDTLAKHFPSKAALLAALYDEFHAAAFVPPADDLDPVAHLADLPARFAAAVKAYPPVPAAVVQILCGAAEPEETDVVAAGLAKSESAVADMIRAGQAAGVVRRALDPPTAARDWLRYLFGRELLRPTDAPPPAADDHAPPPGDVLVHGLLKTDV